MRGRKQENLYASKKLLHGLAGADFNPHARPAAKHCVQPRCHFDGEGSSRIISLLVIFSKTSTCVCAGDCGRRTWQGWLAFTHLLLLPLSSMSASFAHLLHALPPSTSCGNPHVVRIFGVPPCTCFANSHMVQVWSKNDTALLFTFPASPEAILMKWACVCQSVPPSWSLHRQQQIQISRPQAMKSNAFTLSFCTIRNPMKAQLFTILFLSQGW